MIIRQFVLLNITVLLLQWVYARDQLISSPFDNFRLECAKASGATRISVRMVGSRGFRRQDIVFGITCERIDELFPWYGIPMGISDMEREDCYYSQMVDPLIDTDYQFSCRAREYIAGMTRISDTRVQLLCCRLRTRDETNCTEARFGKPVGDDPRSEIFEDKKVINAIAVEDFTYRVRFCELTPRAIGLIDEDVPTTTTKVIPTINEELTETTEAETMTTMAPTTYSTRTPRTTKRRRTTTESPATRRVIIVARPNSLFEFNGDDGRTWDAPSQKPKESQNPDGHIPEISTTAQPAITTASLGLETAPSSKHAFTDPEKYHEQSQEQSEDLPFNPTIVAHAFSPPAHPAPHDEDPALVEQGHNPPDMRPAIPSSNMTPHFHIVPPEPSSSSPNHETSTRPSINKTITPPAHPEESQKVLPVSVELPPIDVDDITSTDEQEPHVDEEGAQLIENSDDMIGRLEPEVSTEQQDSETKKTELVPGKSPITTMKPPVSTTRRPMADTQKPEPLTKNHEKMIRTPIITTGKPMKTTRASPITTRKQTVTTRKPEMTTNSTVDHLIEKLEEPARSQNDQRGSHTASPMLDVNDIQAVTFESQTTGNPVLESATTRSKFTNIEFKEDGARTKEVEQNADGSDTHEQPVDKGLQVSPAEVVDEQDMLDDMDSLLREGNLPDVELVDARGDISQEIQVAEQPQMESELVDEQKIAEEMLRGMMSDVDETKGNEVENVVKSAESTSTKPPTLVTRSKSRTSITTTYQPHSSTPSTTPSLIILKTRATARPTQAHPRTRTHVGIESSSFSAFPSSPSIEHSRTTTASPKQNLQNQNVKSTSAPSKTPPRKSTRKRTHRPPYIDEEVGSSPFDITASHEHSVDVPSLARASSPSPRRGGQRRKTLPSSRRPSKIPSSLEVLLDMKDHIKIPISQDIRRAPIRKPWLRTGTGLKDFTGLPNLPANKLNNNFIFPTFVDQVSSGEADYQESDTPAIALRDGVPTFHPKNNTPIAMPPLIVYDTIDRDNVPTLGAHGADKVASSPPEHVEDNTVESQPPSSESPTGTEVEELVPMNASNEKEVSDDTGLSVASEARAPKTTRSIHLSQEEEEASKAQQHKMAESDRGIIRESIQRQVPTSFNFTPVHRAQGSKGGSNTTYDPRRFYHTPPPKRPPPREKILTFCTKDVAIRDVNNMVIACGGDTDVWNPHRCPPGSECFYSEDSTYRICCAVADTTDFAK